MALCNASSVWVWIVWTEMKRKSEWTILDRYCCNETNKFLSSGSITLSGFIFPSTGSFCATFSDHARAKIWQSQALMVANIELWQKNCRICISKLRMTFLFLEIPCYPQVSTPNKYLLFDLFVTNGTQRATSLFWIAWFSRSKVTSSRVEIFAHWVDTGQCFSNSHISWRSMGKGREKVCTQVGSGFGPGPVQYTQTRLNRLPLVFWPKGRVEER